MIDISVQNMIEFVCPYIPIMVHRRCSRQIHHRDAVYCLSVSWSFVCQFKIDMFFAPSQDDTQQFVKFHHNTLGPHVTHQTGLHVCLSTSHLRTLYIENHGPIKLFTVMYIMASTVKCTLESTVVDLSLCYIICSQIKKVRVLVAKPELLISCHTNHRVPPATAPRVLRIAQVSRQFCWSQHWADCPAHEKSRDRGDFVKSALCALYDTRKHFIRKITRDYKR